MRRIRRCGVVALASGVAYALIGIPCFVLPPQGPLPHHADVVLVLGPATRERMEVARDLLDRGIAGHLLVSIPQVSRVPGTPDFRRWSVCADRADWTCDVAFPHTTQGEARMLRRYARERGWRSVIVVTQSAHLLRARTIVGRCFAGRITMVASGEPPTRGWPYQFAYQTAATLKAWLVTNTC